MTDLVPTQRPGDHTARLAAAFTATRKSRVTPRIRHRKRRIYLNSYGTAGQST